MEFTAANVEIATLSFYNDGNPQINQWLTQAQHSMQAWEFSWTLLEESNQQQVQFFAGNTVYMKVSRYWNEVPKSEYESLKMRLLNNLVRHSDCKLVSQRLAKAFATYILHTIIDDWPTALEDVINMFNPENATGIDPRKAVNLLFNILMIVPCELDNFHDFMKITQNDQKAIKAKLKGESKLVLELTGRVMASTQVENDIKDNVLKCLNWWLMLSLPISTTKDLLISLIPYANYGIMCESVLECLKTAVNDSCSYMFPKIMLEFISEVLGLLPALQEAVNGEDENTATLLYTLFTTVLEAHPKILLTDALTTGENSALVKLVSLLVDCASTPGQYPSDETISSIPFPVWYALQDDLCTFSNAEQAELIKILKPYYMKLIDTFIHKSIMAPAGTLVEDEKELFRCYRQDISDAYMYAYTILREDMLVRFEYHWGCGIHRINQDKEDWRYLESVLHAFSSIAETVFVCQSPLVGKFIERIPAIPFANNLQLVSVALTTLGSYADWLNINQGHLQYAIPIMVTALVHPTLVGSASQALRDLTLECPRTIAPFGTTILQSCEKALKQVEKLDSPETERVLTIISRVLSVSPDDQFIMVCLNNILSPYLHRLNELTAIPETFSVPQKCQELTSHIKLFSCVARHLNVNCDLGADDAPDSTQVEEEKVHRQQPLLRILEPLLPIIADIAVKGSQNFDISECICKLLKNSMTTLCEESEVLLPLSLQIIPSLYKESKNPSVLCIVRQLAVLFGQTSHKDNMRLLMQMVINATLENASQDLWSHTDILQSCFNLAGSIVRKSPFLLSSTDMTLFCRSAIESFKLPEEGTLKSIAYFFVNFVNRTSDPPYAAWKDILLSLLDKLLRMLLVAMCNAHRHALLPISDIFTSLCKVYGNEVTMAFKPIIAEENFPAVIFTEKDKGDFLKKIMRCRGNRKKVLEITSDYSMMIKGIAISMYTQETRRTIM